MKKGAVIGIISVLGFIGALILYLSFVGEEGPQKYEDYLGEIQMKVLEASYMAERAMLYSDSAGKYSIYKSLIEASLIPFSSASFLMDNLEDFLVSSSRENMAE